MRPWEWLDRERNSVGGATLAIDCRPLNGTGVVCEDHDINHDLHAGATLTLVVVPPQQERGAPPKKKFIITSIN